MSDWSPYVLPGSRACRIHSSDDREYQIMLAIPRRDPPPSGFPVIYAVDANALFGTIVEAVRMSSRRSDATGVPDAVIVGVGYPNAELYDRAQRTYDYTFGPPANPADADDLTLATGGGAAFLEFLESNVKQRIQNETIIDPARQTLFGHSLGGLFVLSVFLRCPGSFAAYLASSPSIWWDRNGLAEAVSRLAPIDVARTSVMLCAGEYEQKLAPWQNKGADNTAIAQRRSERAMVDNARDLAQRLMSVGVRTLFHEFPGEDHASVPLLAINRGLRFALQPRENA